jgi:hypothetical protein
LIAQSIDDSAFRAYTLCNIAKQQAKAGLKNEAIATLRQASQLAQYIDDVDPLIEIAKVQLGMALQKEAFETFRKVLQLVQRGKDDRWRVTAFTSVAKALPDYGFGSMEPLNSSELPQPPKTVQEARKVASAAIIAAMLVQESRAAYHAAGRPCACPDDLMRNGRRCGGNSAYSRPGGGAPYCYPSDVPPEAIQRVSKSVFPIA